MNKNDHLLLDIYFRFFLEAASLLPTSLAFGLLPVMGHWFRNWKTNTSGIEPAALYTAMSNMEKAGVVPYPLLKGAVQNYLRYESRFVLENIWIRKKKEKRILRCYSPSDVDRLKTAIGKNPSVVVSAHVPGILSLIELLSIIGHDVSVVAANALNQDLNLAAPIQRIMYDLYSVWIDRQSFIFTDQGNVLEKCKASIEAGKSVYITPDAPGYAANGIKIEMFGIKIGVPAGPVKLAADCSVPIWVVLPFIRTCTGIYNLLVEKIVPTGDIVGDTRQIFSLMERTICDNPARWTGWLYFDKMIRTGEENAAYN